jgi:hypothetical protein
MRWQQPHIEALLDQAIHNLKQPGVRAGEVYAALAFEIRSREKCDVTAVAVVQACHRRRRTCIPSTGIPSIKAADRSKPWRERIGHKDFDHACRILGSCPKAASFRIRAFLQETTDLESAEFELCIKAIHKARRQTGINAITAQTTKRSSATAKQNFVEMNSKPPMATGDFVEMISN